MRDANQKKKRPGPGARSHNDHSSTAGGSWKMSGRSELRTCQDKLG